MAGLRSFVGSEKNRELLTWFGGGVVIIVASLWTVFVYFFPPKSDVGANNIDVSASSGGIAVGGGVANSTLNTRSPSPGDYAPKGK